MRFEDSPNLFGVGGIGTHGDALCGICGQKHNDGNDESGDYSGDSISITEFAGLTVCERCFEAIEDGVLSQMPAILSWYRRIVEAQKKAVDSADKALRTAGA